VHAEERAVRAVKAVTLHNFCPDDDGMIAPAAAAAAMGRDSISRENHVQGFFWDIDCLREEKWHFFA
jgi:hypothetical protein